jgi:hypothetical protein
MRTAMHNRHQACQTMPTWRLASGSGCSWAWGRPFRRAAAAACSRARLLAAGPMPCSAALPSAYSSWVRCINDTVFYPSPTADTPKAAQLPQL